MIIGVLAFQGDVIEHMQALQVLGAEGKEVRSGEDLENVSGLIIPGGESTVIGKFLEETGLRAAILERCQSGSFPIYGTCAGAILLAKEVFSDDVLDRRIQPLGLMNVAISRNAYGRQTESFEETITLDLKHTKEDAQAVFIRAPKVHKVGSNVHVLASHKGIPVAYREGPFLASTFHPELSEMPSPLHRYFLSLVSGGGMRGCH